MIIWYNHFILVKTPIAFAMKQTDKLIYDKINMTKRNYRQRKRLLLWAGFVAILMAAGVGFGIRGVMIPANCGSRLWI